MSPLTISLIIFGIVFAASVLGMVLRSKLPDRHVGESSKDIVRLVMGLIATMAALVLGLLIASAKSSYDTQSAELVQLSAEIIQLDRILSLYGPESLEARAQFRSTVERGIDHMWPSDSVRSANLALTANVAGSGDFYTSISNLDPQTDARRVTQSLALKVAADLSRTRVLMYEQSGSSIPLPFLVVLVFWLAVIFTAFGLFAPANATVLATFLVGALSVAGALFLILELDRPYEGLMQLSSAPMRSAAAQIGPRP